ncbi:hypothetical protein Dda_1407 [Drechslerella dactyloides]|uniref:Uncharacterized protein n=1 Tax=Drechslerella dactyloides TaxID=74499 RepID=A0AAD6J1Z1_DREDA|nr:hypothetical protein Dda_1407 [Drechslerella dactyloides]
MAKLLLSRARSKSESRVGRKTKDTHKFDDEPLPNSQYIPRQISALVAEADSTPKGSFDVYRPKTSGGRGPSPGTPERPKTSHGKKNNGLDEPSFSMLNRSYTWSREQFNSMSRPSSRRGATNSPMLHAFPPRSSSRQRSYTASPAGFEIGVAVSGEASHPKTLSDARSSRVYDLDDISKSLPQHYISLDHQFNGSVCGDSHDAASTAETKDTAPRTGWRKFFGKGLFHKKSPQKSLQSQISQVSVTTVNSPVCSTQHSAKVSIESLREESPIIEIDTVESETPSPQLSKFESSPLLDVDIPKVELERYSIMFDALLNQQPKPSIYARRKSGMNGIATGGRQSPESSSSDSTPTIVLPKKKDALPVGQLGLVNKSPLWLFPATPRTPKSPGRPRAMTTPTESTTATSPAAVTPDTSTFRKPRPESDIVPSLLMMLEERGQRSAPQTDKEPQTPFSIISEGSELDSPYSPVEGNGSNFNGPWVRKFSMLDEPEWEMVTTTPLRPRTPTPTELDPSMEEGEAYVAKAAKISIARQISISQRQLLLPVISNPERFVSRSRSLRSQNPKTEDSTVAALATTKLDSVDPNPALAVPPETIALAL